MKIEKQWLEFNFPCLITINTELGFRCGYVGIPTNHPLHGTEYGSTKYFSKKEILRSNWSDKIKILMIANKDYGIDISRTLSAHRGITFSGVFNNKELTLQNPDYYYQHWFFGYDCGHYADKKDFKLIENKTMLEILKKSHKGETGTIKTQKFCINECKSLATQLNIINSPLVGEQVFIRKAI
jgi:hypothetical protein